MADSLSLLICRFNLLVLPFEPADAKRSTKCVAGSHFKVQPLWLYQLFLPAADYVLGEKVIS